ncbi:hypothetical protein FRC14_004787 [Serendipita sp. 396]|nr:hypothetical protein FRC14_004787 [Serendipita sp. 396]KAG8789331.1 hypothetical protein FRC15_009383 [Serendipita sp. 397]KAG8804565.1 hypothetical protein FRC16_006007 [Serendipita sp. 398]KAG8857395.1 hypothetical protein FRB91_011411 [Serendipita sp. 411]KAG8878686.1 hypothetical protein FRC20_006363 [Serendipita sp. 405]
MSLQTSSIDKITIVGAGIGGLVLARILQQAGIKVVIYEREASLNSRSQGGTLDMHEESGLLALRMANLFDQFQKYSSYEADEFLIRGKDGSVAFSDQDPDAAPHLNERPEIDRKHLRQILIDSLEPDTIRWGHTLRSIAPSTDGSPLHDLTFERQEEDGSRTRLSVRASFVVGADGAWSRVRSLLSSVMPHYSGVCYVESEITDVDNRFPEIAKFIRDGHMFAIEDNKGIVTQRCSGGVVKVATFWRVPETWMKEQGLSSESDPEQTRARLLELFNGWSEETRNIIRACDPTFVPRPLVVLEPYFTWRTTPGVTLLGDAAHVMSPFAGEGANMAMLDAVELATALIKVVKKDGRSTTPIDGAIRAYEQKMQKRAGSASKESTYHMDLFISSNAPKAAANRMRFLFSLWPPRPLVLAHLLVQYVFDMFSSLFSSSSRSTPK